MRKLRADEIDTLLDYLENFIGAIERDDPERSEWSTSNLKRIRLTLKEYIQELVGEE